MTDKPKILLAEDEPALALIVKETLESKGFDVLHCLDGEAALKSYLDEHVDILVLDVMMPKKDGFTLAREIRQKDSITPILFLTAKSQTQDVVSGFKLGGNDYLKKPFSMEELIVRIENLLKDKSKNQSSITSIGTYEFDFKRLQLTHEDGTVITLTHREAELLKELLIHKNEVLDRSETLQKLWNNNDFFSARSMDVFITKLRKKLNKDANIQIVNVRGYGYKLIC